MRLSKLFEVVGWNLKFHRPGSTLNAGGQDGTASAPPWLSGWSPLQPRRTTTTRGAIQARSALPDVPSMQPRPVDRSTVGASSEAVTVAPRGYRWHYPNEPLVVQKLAPNLFLVRLVTHRKAEILTKNSFCIAVDLGFENGDDTRYLIDEGFKKVYAIDIDPRRAHFLDEEKNSGRVEVFVGTIENARIPAGQADLLNAHFVLSFVDRTGGYAGVASTLRHCHRALRPGGFFVGALFGEKNQWPSDSLQPTKFTPEKIIQIFREAGFEEISTWSVDKGAGPAQSGKDHPYRHHYCVTARKPALGNIPGIDEISEA